MTSQLNNQFPTINWIKNDPKKYKYFYDGSVFLIAVMVKNSIKESERWELDVIRVSCDGDWFCLEYRSGEIFDAWEWEDVEYFHLIEGEMPTTCEENNGN